MTFQDGPTNWDRHFDDLMERALNRLHILRVCKRNGYSVSDVDYLFHCDIMSLLLTVLEFEVLLLTQNTLFRLIAY